MFKGKAGSLAYLQGLGLSVPEWKLLTHSEIVSWGSQILWKEFWDGLTKDKLENPGQSLTAFLGSVVVPPELIKKFSDGPWAVRSSATVEDSRDNSFAGIFSTKLLVMGDVAPSIKEVWSSLFSSGALQYCRERAIPFRELGMDVIVQKMIIGEKSGVLFQANPSGLITQQVIVAGWGVGQGIVDDITDTDRFIIEGAQVTETSLADKKQQVAHDRSQNKLIKCPVPPENAKIPVLTAAEISDLLRASEIVALGNPFYMDLEFTFSSGKLFVLQARPITTIPSKASILIFDNSNIAENYPHQSTPMSFTGLRNGYARNFKNLLTYLGFPEEELKAIDHNLNYLVSSWGGQIYYNLNNWYAVYGLLPVGADKAIESFNDMVGIKGSGFIKKPKRSVLKKVRILLTILPKFLGYFLRSGSHHKSYKQKFQAHHRKAKAEALEAKHALEILALMQNFESTYLDMIRTPLMNDFFSSMLNLSCRTLAVRIAGPEGAGIYNDLLSHREDLESSKAIYSLISLAQIVSGNVSLREFLSNHQNDPTVMAKLLSQDEAFHKKLYDHLERYGDRSQWEMKLEVATSRENPAAMLKLIITYADNHLSQEDQRNREREKSQRARSALTQRALRHPLKGALFFLLFKKCTEALCFREDARFDRVRCKGFIRSQILHLGEILLRRNQLEKAEDLFFLTLEELHTLPHDSFGSGYLKELISLRKRYFEKHKDHVLPDRIILNDLSPVDRFRQDKLIRSTEEVFGLPCSGGEIEAECVVVKDLNEVTSLIGKILIAQRTDPAWGFFFVGVKGIIIEKGSILSHAAIISRELGIPCIINVEDATRMYETGMRLSMNGDTGQIRVLSTVTGSGEPVRKA